MTPESQRIAIAKACGWTEIRCHPKTKVWFAIPPPERRPQHDVLLPDYLSDLNACHEMEKVLTDEQFKIYAENIYDMTNGQRGEISATAAQRCEAFLRTIGKWEEVP